MRVWRTDMRVDPAPRVEGAILRFIVIVPVMAVFMVIIVVGVSMSREVIALHVYSTMEIRVRLVYKCLTDCLASVAKRDGKSAFALHDLWHTFDISAAEANKAPYKRDAADVPKNSADCVHRRFLPNTKDASESRTET